MDASLGLALLMWAGAAWSDLRTRRVPNLYWLPFLAAALVLATRRVAADGLWYGVALATAGAFYLMWRANMFGGADAKGLMVTALILPTPGSGLFPPALDVLVNASLLVVLLYPVTFLVRNLAARRFTPAMALGVPRALAEARRSFAWPMQEVRQGEVRWRFWHRPTEDLEERYRALEAAGLVEVWVTPKIPFAVAILLGLLVYAAAGNVLLSALAPALS